MKKEYVRDMRAGIDGNFKMLFESLKEAKGYSDEGRNVRASRELRELVDGVIQTLEIMSTLELVENDLLMEALNHER